METGTTTMGCDLASAELAAASATFSVALTDTQRDLFARYCRLVLEANQGFNLTAMRSPDEVSRKLFLDSLLIARSIPSEFKKPEQRASVYAMDVGSGAGIPGLPLKILYPHWFVSLIDSVAKKARFLASVVEHLRLDGVSVLCERAETLAGRTELRDAADLCFARAVAPMAALLELCAPFVRPGGWLFFPKSGDLEQEMLEAEEAARLLRCALDRIDAIPETSGLGANRCVVVYRKTAQTPDAFPRHVGDARSKPLSGELMRRGKRQSHETPEHSK